MTIEADGPLPEPVSGHAEALPPRFFLDFPGVVANTRGAVASNDLAVRRVRVALHSAQPPVTRVVIDLHRFEPASVDLSARAAGRVRVTIGANPAGSAAPPDPLAPLLPPVQTSPSAVLPGQTGSSAPSSKPAPPPMPPAASGSEVNRLPPPGVNPLPRAAVPGEASGRVPTRDIEKYRRQIDGPLNRFRSLRPVLSSIDALQAQQPETFKTPAAELDAVRTLFASVQPPPSLEPTHDMLRRSCALALLAVTIRRDSSSGAESLRNAASAAAGALLLLDRACIEIGCQPLGAAR